MEWVSRRWDEIDQKRRDQAALLAAATRLFEDLKNRVEFALITHNSRGPHPNNNEAYLDQGTVRLGTPIVAGGYQPTPNSNYIELKHVPPTTITANYSSGTPSAVFVMEQDPNGYLRIKYGQDVVSLDKATEIILSDFLFA